MNLWINSAEDVIFH